MKSTIFPRFGAYLIDIILVGIIGFGFSYLSFLNPNQEQYDEVSQEVIQLYEDFSNNEITVTEYEERYVSLSYDLNRSNWVYTIINLVLLVAYFMIVPIFLQGQTLGKRFFKIKVVSCNETEKVSIFSYFIRAVIQNNILITIVQLIILFTFTKENYYTIYSNVNLVGYVLLYLIVFLALIRKDSRGLHDLVAGTKVVPVIQEEVLIRDDIIREDSSEKKEILLEEKAPKKEISKTVGTKKTAKKKNDNTKKVSKESVKTEVKKSTKTKK